jgi:cytochrome c553
MQRALPLIAAFLLIGCGEEAAQKQTKTQETKQEVVQTETPKEVVKPEEPKEVAQTQTPKEVVAQKVTQEPKQPEPVVAAKEAQPAEVVVQKDGATLYKACASCHGADASKSALNKSQVIKGWSAQKIADALSGYKNGTYGGASKALMLGQVKNLSEADIKTLSEHIAKF